MALCRHWQTYCIHAIPPGTQALETYSIVGRLLLRLRRVAGALEGAWAGMRAKGRAARGVAMPPEARPLWQLRAQMAHFLTCLQHYLQVSPTSSPVCTRSLCDSNAPCKSSC